MKKKYSDLITCCIDKLTPEVKRCLLLISKCLQSLANDVQEFKKQEYMKPLSILIEQYIPNVMNFFQLAAVSSAICSIYSIPDKSVFFFFSQRCDEQIINSIPKGQGFWNDLSPEDFCAIHSHISQNLV